MLVIHPTDRTTEMLSILYEGLEARLIEADCSNKEMGHLLHHTSPSERIMLLGHGSDKGLFFRKSDEEEGFDKIIVRHPHAFHLRNHGSNIIGISEMSEAEEYGVTTDKESMDRTNRLMFTQLRRLLDNGTPLHEIPERLKALDTTQSELSRFNYERFYYV